MFIPLHPISDFEVPDDFPVQPYIDIHQRAVVAQGDTDERSEFVGAWTAVAYRYTACTEHDAKYTESVRRAGQTPGFPDRYTQDQELFGFFVTGLSAVESLCYGCYALGYFLNPTDFPFTTNDDRRGVTPSTTMQAFTRVFPRERIGVILQTMLKDAEYKTWAMIRNILAHRTSPGRLISAGSGPTTVEWKTSSISLDQMTTASRRAWLIKTMEAILIAAKALPF
jgi:hypothetical protein